MGLTLKGEVEDSSSEISVEISADFDPNTCLDASWAIESVQIELK